MSNISNAGHKTRRLTGLAFLTAIIIVLQIVCSFIHFGPFSITLALAPIIIGAAIYGIGAGVYLGTVFGTIVLIAGLFSWDGGFTLILLNDNALATIAICIVKGAAAGLAAGILYRLISKKNVTAGVITAGVVCPIVNTGLFIVGMLVFFFPMLKGMAHEESQELTYYIIFTLTGLNFLVELAVNMLFSTAITRIIKAKNRIS